MLQILSRPSFARVLGGAIVASIMSLAPFAQAQRPTFSGSVNGVAHSPAAPSADPELLQREFVTLALQIPSAELEAIPVQNNGRVKPLMSIARETILFMMGAYGKWGLDPVQFYLELTLFEQSPELKVVNVRDPELRERLGLSKSEKLFSALELERSPLMAMAEPLVDKQQKDSRSLTPSEKNVLEAYQQFWLLKQVGSGSHLLEALDLSLAAAQGHEHMEGDQAQVPPSLSLGRSLLGALARNDAAGAIGFARELKQVAPTLTMPELFRAQLPKLEAEVFYLKSRVFLWAAILFVVLGLVVIMAPAPTAGVQRLTPLFAAVPLVLSGVGFGARVWITGFAPVTNMYGTMLWVAFGVGLFSLILFYLYRNRSLTGLLWIGSGLVLLLAESMPLILSPDMDPIVAVLRSNFWLTIHVLTITISYAALTIAMLIGNVALIRALIKKQDGEFQKTYAHAAYRMIQLGVFLLSVGIVLGGVWADYSWGRFWGWDPKETWALIADLGFLAILHARFIGWLGPYGLLAASPLAFLLVIMAWYGVNFILATGLHSYGFSSGGTKAVVAFVIAQVAIIVTALLVHQLRRTKRESQTDAKLSA